MAFVRFGDGVLTAIEAGTPGKAYKARAALAVTNLSIEAFDSAPIAR